MRPSLRKALGERAATRRELEAMRRMAAGSPEVKEYVDRLRPISCAACGRLVFTPEGKDMFCARCMRPVRVVERPSVPMGRQLRERGKRA